MHLAAICPGFPDQLDLALVLPGAAAERALQPGVETAGLDAKATAHCANEEDRAMLGDKRVLHFASLAKYAAAFLRNSQSWLVW